MLSSVSTLIKGSKKRSVESAASDDAPPAKAARKTRLSRRSTKKGPASPAANDYTVDEAKGGGGKARKTAASSAKQSDAKDRSKIKKRQADERGDAPSEGPRDKLSELARLATTKNTKKDGLKSAGRQSRQSLNKKKYSKKKTNIKAKASKKVRKSTIAKSKKNNSNNDNNNPQAAPIRVPQIPPPSDALAINDDGRDYSNLVNSFKRPLFKNPSPPLAQAYKRRDAAAMKRRLIKQRKKQVLEETQQIREEILKLREKFKNKKEDLLNVNSMLKDSSREVGGWNKKVFDLELKESPCLWNEKLQMLRDYCTANGGPPTLYPPPSKLQTEEERKLLTFVRGIIKNVEKNHPCIQRYPHRKQALEELGIKFTENDHEKERHFEFMFKKLMAYKREHGSYRMPHYEVIKSSGNDELVLLHNWVFSEVTLSDPSHMKRFKAIGFSFDSWCGADKNNNGINNNNNNNNNNNDDDDNDDDDNNNTPKTKAKLTRHQSTSSSKHNGVRDMVRLAIINFLRTRHKNGRIQHGAISEAVRKFGYSSSGVKAIWDKHKDSVLDPTKGIDVRNCKGNGRKSKYDVEEIKQILLTLPPAKKRTVFQIAKACNVATKSTMHRLLHVEPELLKIAKEKGLVVKPKGPVPETEMVFCDRKRKIGTVRFGRRRVPYPNIADNEDENENDNEDEDEDEENDDGEEEGESGEEDQEYEEGDEDGEQGSADGGGGSSSDDNSWNSAAKAKSKRQSVEEKSMAKQNNLQEDSDDGESSSEEESGSESE